MPKFLYQANYTTTGIQGLLQEAERRDDKSSKRWAESRAASWRPSTTPLAVRTCT